MPTTSRGYRYPLGSAAPNIPADLANLAADVNTDVGSLAAPPIFQAALPANQAIPNNVITAVNFGASSELIKIGAVAHSTTTNTSRVIPGIPGYWRCSLHGLFTANATGDRRIYVGKNATALGPIDRLLGSNTASLTQHTSRTLQMNGTTDYFEFLCFQVSGANLDMIGAGDSTFSTFMEVEFVRAL